jgi:hypothetical protein
MKWSTLLVSFTQVPELTETLTLLFILIISQQVRVLFYMVMHVPLFSYCFENPTVIHCIEVTALHYIIINSLTIGAFQWSISILLTHIT